MIFYKNLKNIKLLKTNLEWIWINSCLNLDEFEQSFDKVHSWCDEKL